MKSIVRGLAFAAALATCSAVSASAGIIPDPAASDIPNVVISPNGSLEYIVTVRDNNSVPLNGVMVEIEVTTAADALVCWCSGQTHPDIAATTNGAGEASFFLNGGGCVNPAALGTVAVKVYADGILMAEVGLVSPDAVDPLGILPTAGWNPGPSCDVGLSDATYHTGPISTGGYDYCTDIDSDGSVALADAVILTGPISTGESCAN